MIHEYPKTVMSHKYMLPEDRSLYLRADYLGDGTYNVALMGGFPKMIRERFTAQQVVDHMGAFEAKMRADKRKKSLKHQFGTLPLVRTVDGAGGYYMNMVGKRFVDNPEPIRAPQFTITVAPETEAPQLYVA